MVGIGGLGHIAVQYAVAMGMRVAAVDIDPKKLALAKKLGAEFLVNAREENPVSAIRKGIGGVHGAVVAAVATQAFEQSIGMLRPGGTVVFLGLPGGKADELRASIAAISGRELSIRGLQRWKPARSRGGGCPLRCGARSRPRSRTAPLSAANAVLNRIAPRQNRRPRRADDLAMSLS